jgi:nucleoside-diphosphate-sugar epimerase
MNALLLGSTGWIGQNVKRQRPNWNWTEISSKNCNLEDSFQIEKITGKFDVVIHAAGFYGGLQFNKKYKEQILFKNVQMNINVCKIIKKIKPKKFIIIGSGCLYPSNNNLLLESIIGDRNFHSSVKYSAMAKINLLDLVSTLDLNFEYLIVSNTYGPGEHLSFEKSHVVGSLINKFKNCHDLLEMIGTGAGVRDYIYIEDVAEAICRYTELENTTNSCTNISSGKETSVKDIVKILSNFYKEKNLRIVWGDAKDDGVLYKVLDNTKMQKEINFIPKTQLEEGLEKTWRWFNA